MLDSHLHLLLLTEGQKYEAWVPCKNECRKSVLDREVLSFSLYRVLGSPMRLLNFG